MARRTHPRQAADHERTAADVLGRYSARTGWTPALPVPIELVIEEAYGLRIITRQIEEPPDVRILGGLFQDEAAIVLNERHGQLFETVIGPLEFTLAHELGHWLYDADAGQGALFEPAEPVFCYVDGTGKAPDSVRLREINANKLAAAVLMPAVLVRQVDPLDLVSHHRQYAQQWGVSARTLEIRLQELGIASVNPSTNQPLWR
jgi:Zn-dependent peptidase ImmA (M78 family)